MFPAEYRYDAGKVPSAGERNGFFWKQIVSVFAYFWMIFASVPDVCMRYDRVYQNKEQEKIPDRRQTDDIQRTCIDSICT